MPVGTYKETFPTVHGTTPVLPIPTVAVSFKVARDWVLAFGAWAPYAALTTYPTTVGGGQPAPQRYSLISLEGSLLTFVGAGVAWAPVKQLRAGRHRRHAHRRVQHPGRPSPAACPIASSAPRKSRAGTSPPSSAPAPSSRPPARIGAIVVPHPAWRIGASFQLPVWVRSPATLDVRLPATPVFQDASQQGNSGRVAFDLPWTLRAGVETRVVENLRLELSFGYEAWSMHELHHVHPRPTSPWRTWPASRQSYYVPPVTLPRYFQNSESVHLGAEYTLQGSAASTGTPAPA